MALKLNTLRKTYREFYGRNVEQMPLLVADNRVPMNVSQLMQRRLDVRNSDAEVKSAWMDNYFDTSDGVAYHLDGRVKVILDSQTLRYMTPDTPRVGGALLLTEDIYNALESEEFKKGKLGKVNEWMSRGDVKAHPVWRVLARDQGLLNDYADYIFCEYQAKFFKNTPLEDIRAMEVFPGSAGDCPKMMAWFVDRLEGRSSAYGGDDLDLEGGRFVGIAPEALSALGSVAQRAASHERRVLTVGEVLEETNQTSAYAPDQIRKLQNILDQRGYAISIK